ncbi:MAG: D-alanyl-D-alanine carboxypeptidase [Rickettsiales bacterium]|jgi:D-alanyl-D-alanine carboxypeptidase (penicillin-binding protein 5/6)|nr:D-alanyl-D-alanine carboxypeptidase [Rickettsiales bacterium]
MKIFFIFYLLIFILPAAHAFSTPAKSAYLYDYHSGAVLFDKDADELMPPSSMLKLMTIALGMQALQDGELKLADKLPVSKNADYQNPVWHSASKICLSEGQRVSVSDLLDGMIVLSGGDASVVLAEKLAGSESAFTDKMTAFARGIGMENSTFGNATGLPHPDNLMTSRELGILAKYIIDKFPEYYPRFAQRRFEFGDFKSDWCRQWGASHTLNYNKLLFIMGGADGLKTGHTSSGGYGMVASARRGGRRLIGVINGLRAADHNALAGQMKKLLEFGFSDFQNKSFIKSDAVIAEIPVWYGRRNFVAAGVANDFVLTFQKNQTGDGIKIIARYEEPLRAPVSAGQKLGAVIAMRDGREIARADLVAKSRVGRAWFFGRIMQNIRVIFNGR